MDDEQGARDKQGARVMSRRALLIGGSGALGCALARQLATDNVDVLMHGGRDRAAFEGAIASITAETGKAIAPLWHPITDIPQFLRYIRAYLPVDILIVIFGPLIKKPLSATTYDDWHAMSAYNFTLPATLLSYCAPHFHTCNYGRALFFGADYATSLRGYTSMAAYGAAKWALASAVLSAAQQIANPHARIYLVCPGHIAPHRAEMPRRTRQQTWDIAPLANAIAYLLHERCHFASGAILNSRALSQCIR